MKATGFIVLHRQILDWEWYLDINTRCLFIHILLRTNFADDEWRGIKIAKGQLITSLETLSKETRMSKQEVRTALSKLKSTREITYTSTHNYTVITVANWELYQDCTRKSTRKSHAEYTPINTKSTTDNKRIYKYIYKNKTKETNIDFVEEMFLESFTKWLDYKVSENKMYKSDISLKQSYNNLVKISNNNPRLANEIVNRSIGNNWVGLFPIKDWVDTYDPKKQESNLGNGGRRESTKKLLSEIEKRRIEFQKEQELNFDNND